MFQNLADFKTRPEILERIKRIQQRLPAALRFSPGEPARLNGQDGIDDPGLGRRVATINFPRGELNYFIEVSDWLEKLAMELEAQDPGHRKIKIRLFLPSGRKAIKVIST